jgi:Protein ChrB, N-terminal
VTWLLFIYTVPSEPSRKRAYIWREVKKVGAIYLRDGVCALPEREETMAAFRKIAAKVTEFDGEATARRRLPRRRIWMPCGQRR